MSPAGKSLCTRNSTFKPWEVALSVGRSVNQLVICPSSNFFLEILKKIGNDFILKEFDFGRSCLSLIMRALNRSIRRTRSKRKRKFMGRNCKRRRGKGGNIGIVKK